MQKVWHESMSSNLTKSIVLTNLEATFSSNKYATVVLSRSQYLTVSGTDSVHSTKQYFIESVGTLLIQKKMVHIQKKRHGFTKVEGFILNLIQNGFVEMKLCIKANKQNIS